MTKIILLLIMIIICSVFTSAIICEDRTNPTDIPCEVITPVISGCGNFTYNLTNANTNTTIITEGNMSSLMDGRYNFSLNQPNGDYAITLCEGTSSSITIGFETGFDSSYIYLISFIIMTSLLIGGYTMKNAFFLLFGGMASILLGIGLVITGYPGFDTEMLNLMSIILIGIGFYYIVSPAIAIIRGAT